MRRTTWAARLGVLFAALALLGVFAPSALAQEEPGGQGGQSTPGVIVTAQNPGTSPGSTMRITLAAGTARSIVENPSCRPQDVNLRCWGSLVLRIPAAEGLSVTGFQVHRVAVGTTDFAQASCNEHEDSCEGEMTATAADSVGARPLYATVRGRAVLTDAGNTGMTPGPVQVFINLTDAGAAQYGDQVQVLVRPFVQGPNKPPWTYDSEQQTIQQVSIRYLGNSGS